MFYNKIASTIYTILNLGIEMDVKDVVTNINKINANMRIADLNLGKLTSINKVEQKIIIGSNQIHAHTMTTHTLVIDKADDVQFWNKLETIKKMVAEVMKT